MADDVGVTALPALQYVVTGAADQNISAEPAFQGIQPCVALEVIVSGFPDDRICPAAAIKPVSGAFVVSPRNRFRLITAENDLYRLQGTPYLLSAHKNLHVDFGDVLLVLKNVCLLTTARQQRAVGNKVLVFPCQERGSIEHVFVRQAAWMSCIEHPILLLRVLRQ